MFFFNNYKNKKILYLLLIINITIVSISIRFIIHRIKNGDSVLLNTTKIKKGLKKRDSQIQKARNILFQYRNSKPLNVSIVGDFNNWIPQKMTKEKNHTWKIVFKLEHGEYNYQFVVDGKWIKDSYNPNSKPDGYGGENSVLIVKTLEDERKK